MVRNRIIWLVLVFVDKITSHQFRRWKLVLTTKEFWETFGISTIGSKMCWYTSSKATQALQILDDNEVQINPSPPPECWFKFTCSTLMSRAKHWCHVLNTCSALMRREGDCVHRIFIFYKSVCECWNPYVNVEIYWENSQSVSTLLLPIVGVCGLQGRVHNIATLFP